MSFTLYLIGALFIIAGVAWALGYMKDTRSFIPLRQLLADQRLEVRLAVVTVSAVMGGARAVRLPMMALKDPERTVRLAAISAIDTLGDPAGARALIEMMVVSDEPIRRRIATALLRLTGQDYGTDLVQWQDWMKKQPEGK